MVHKGEGLKVSKKQFTWFMDGPKEELIRHAAKNTASSLLLNILVNTNRNNVCLSGNSENS